MEFASDFIFIGSLLIGIVFLPAGIIHICNRGDRKMTFGVICVVFGFAALVVPHVLYLLSYFGIIV